MTEDIEATLDTIDSLHMRREYDNIRDIVKHAVEALHEDGQSLDIAVPGLAGHIFGEHHGEI